MIKIVILSSVAVLAVFAGYDVPETVSAPAASNSDYGTAASNPGYASASQGYGQALPVYAPRYVQALPVLPSRHSYLFPRRRHHHDSRSSSSSEEFRGRRCPPPFDLCKTSDDCSLFTLPGYSKGDKTVTIRCLSGSPTLLTGKGTPIASFTGEVHEVKATCGRNGKWIANDVKFLDAKCAAVTEG